MPSQKSNTSLPKTKKHKAEMSQTGGSAPRLDQKINGKRAHKFGALTACLVPFLFYVYYLCPTIAAGDSGELITSAKILGIPHPPGYPLFTLIGHLFSYLPIHSVAWRVNLSSAVFCSLTCLLVYLSLFRLTANVWAALTGALGLALSRFFWHYAEVAEVFPLHLFFTALLTYFLTLIKTTVGKKQHAFDPQAIRYFWASSFVFGLALTNHHTIVLLAPAMLFFLWHVAPSLFRTGKVFGVAVLLFLWGFSLYLYCPFAALAKPAINWDNPITWQNFFRLLTRADYGTFTLVSSEVQPAVSVSRFEQLPVFFAGLYQQFTGLGIGLALVGIFHFNRHKLFQGYLALAFFFSGFFFVTFANMPIQNPLLLGVLHRFYLMPAVIFSFWVGLGLNGFMQWLAQKKIPRQTKRLLPVVLISGLLVWEFTANVEEADFRNNYMAENFARNILLSLPENSVFFVRGDVASMGVDYLQIVMGMRPDVICLDQSKLTYAWFYQQAKERFPKLNLPGERYDGRQVLNRDLIANNISNFPICFMDFKEESYRQAFNAVPNGLVYMMLPKAQAYSPEDLEKQFDQFYSKMTRAGLERDYPATSFEYEVKQIYAGPFFRLGFEFQQAGDLAKAEAYYKRALALNAANYRVTKNLAVLYFYQLHRRDDGVNMFKRYLELRPNDTEAAKIKQIIATYDRPLQ